MAPKLPKEGEWGSKTQNGRFPSKIAFQLNKVCNKVSLCEYCQQQCSKALTGLSIRAKMVPGERPTLRENLAVTDSPLQKRSQRPSSNNNS